MWVLGIVEPGWYLAAAVWSDTLAKHWRGMGYEVENHDPRLDKKGDAN